MKCFTAPGLQPGCPPLGVLSVWRKDGESNPEGAHHARPLSKRLPSPIGWPFQSGLFSSLLGSPAVSPIDRCVEVSSSAVPQTTRGQRDVGEAGLEPAFLLVCFGRQHPILGPGARAKAGDIGCRFYQPMRLPITPLPRGCRLPLPLWGAPVGSGWWGWRDSNPHSAFAEQAPEACVSTNIPPQPHSTCCNPAGSGAD